MSFMISTTSRDTFGGFTLAVMIAKKYSMVVAVMINPSLIGSSMFFSPVNTTHLFMKLFIIILLNLKHAASSWVYRLFLLLIFIQGLKIFVVIC